MEVFLFVELGIDAVVSDQPVYGANPKIAVGVLVQPVDGCAGETVVGAEKTNESHIAL